MTQAELYRRVQADTETHPLPDGWTCFTSRESVALTHPCGWVISAWPTDNGWGCCPGFVVVEMPNLAAIVPTFVCWDCGARIGDPHLDGCDVARCLATGDQRLACDDDGHDCGDQMFDGYWPGELDCYRLGIIDGDGKPDLNRLHRETVWNPEHQRREPRGATQPTKEVTP